MIYLGEESGRSTNPGLINKVMIGGGMYDKIYFTNNSDWGYDVAEEKYSSIIPTDWTKDTILYCDYDGSLNAGNVDWDSDEISHIVIKRKKVDDLNWTVVHVEPIEDAFEIEIRDVDITPTTGEYVYAMVPSLYGIDGAYYTSTVNVEQTKLVLADDTGVWATFITDGSCNTVNTTPIVFQQTMYCKYPTAITNTITNYQTITVTGEFYPMDDDCDFDSMLDDSKRNKYIKEFVDFLTNRRPKILKSSDGRSWIVMIDTGVSDTMKDYYRFREISFSAVEIGNPDITEDLAMAGIYDIPEEWW